MIAGGPVDSWDSYSPQCGQMNGAWSVLTDDEIVPFGVFLRCLKTTVIRIESSNQLVVVSIENLGSHRTAG